MQSIETTKVPHATSGAMPTQNNTRGRSAPLATANASTSAVKQQCATATEDEVVQEAHEDAHDQNEGPEDASIVIKDAGVSDVTCNQLQEDARKADEEKRECRRLAEEEEKLRQWLKKCADASRERELDEIERKKRELEEKSKREAEAQAKLMKMGVCPVGYHWIRQSGGYRCAGGSHRMSDNQLKKL